jgi:hypothetical protein
MTHDSFQAQTTTTQLGQNPQNSPFSSLRLTQNFGETLGVKKVLTTVPVGRPSKDRFFRTHKSPNMVFPAMLLENKATNEVYLASAPIAGVLGTLVRPVELHAAIDRQGNPSLIPVPLPDQNGNRNPWHQSLADAVARSQETWIRITANKAIGGYDIYEANAKLPEPIWPTESMDTLLEVAFRGRILNDPNHPVVVDLLGGV